MFDTDGVITRTAAVHFAAWKQVFDPFLVSHGVGDGARPFTDADYRRHVDGIGRYDGVAALVADRGIELPWGSPEDAPGDATVCALGNRKNAAFAEAVARDGVEPYRTTRRFIERLHDAGVRTAVISASKNCRLVLDAAGMADLFDVARRRQRPGRTRIARQAGPGGVPDRGRAPGRRPVEGSGGRGRGVAGCRPDVRAGSPR